MNICPHCGANAISFWKKQVLGPGRSAQCQHCKKKITVHKARAWLCLSPILIGGVLGNILFRSNVGWLVGYESAARIQARVRTLEVKLTTTLRNRYWRGTILLPALGALAGYIVPSEYALFLTADFFLVAIPYVPFAVLMWWLVGRTHSSAAVIALALAAPIIFLSFFAAFAEILSFAMPSADWVSLLSDFLPLALGIAYAYVALSLIVFLLVKLAVSRGARKKEPGVLA